MKKLLFIVLLPTLFLFMSAGLLAENIRSIQSGNWSDGSTWDGGSVPNQGDDVIIDKGHTVVYDLVSSEEIRTIHVRGLLTFSRTKNTQLDVGMIVVSTKETIDFDANCSNHQMGPSYTDELPPALEVGTFDNPIPDNYTAVIRLTYFSDLDPSCAPGIITYNGRMDFHGAPVNKTWVKIGDHALDGDNTVTLAESVDWPVGSRIIVTRSTRPSGNIINTGSYKDNGQIQTEERVMTGMNGNVITLDDALDHDHPLMRNGQYAGEVALLSHNVVVTSKDPDGVRGHTMYHHGAQGSISYAEFSHLGKEGILARYPIHFHLLKESNRGSFVIGASIWDSHNRFVTIHGTNYLYVKDCVGYQSLGHGFFMEDASEVFNFLDRNLAVQCFDENELPNQALAYDDNDGAGFWWANALNAFSNNVAVETDKYGFQFEIRGNIDMNVMQPDGNYSMEQVDQLSNVFFKDNEAHGTMEYGLVLQGADAPTNDPFYVENMLTWGCWRATRPDLNNFYFKNLTSWNHAYGMYAIDPKNGRVENYHAIRTGNHAMSFQDTPEGLITFEEVTIDSSNEYPFKVYGRDPRQDDMEVHIRNYTVTNTEYGWNGAASTSGVEPTPYIALFLHDWFGPNQDAKVIPDAQSPNDGLNYQDMSPIFRSDIKVAETDVPFPNNPITLGDNMPPATTIIYPAKQQQFSSQTNQITVIGTCIDVSNVTSVTVNGVQATPLEDNYALWQVTLTNLPSSGIVELTSKATDEHGNVELNPHRIKIGMGTLPVGIEGENENPSIVSQYELGENYPNPFNPETQISFTVSNELQGSSQVRLTIYNSLGQAIRTLVNENLAAGSYVRTWDGRDNYGQQMASGIYIYEMTARSSGGAAFRQAKKMLLVR